MTVTGGFTRSHTRSHTHAHPHTQTPAQTTRPAGAAAEERVAMYTPSWMGDLPAALKARTLSGITLPGSHDSGAYGFSAEVLDAYQTELIVEVQAGAVWLEQLPGMAGMAGFITNSVLTKSVADWGRTQTMDIGEQLLRGIRYFDLRVMMYQGTPYFFHGFVCAPVSGVLEQVRAFTDARPSEVIVLAFSHMKTLNAADHIALANLIQTTIGLDRLCAASDVASLSLAELQAAKKRVVVFYDSLLAPRATYPWLLQQDDYYYTPGFASNTIDGLISACDAAIAAAPPGKPLKIGFTTTPENSDIGYSIANQFNPFTGTHDLHWFTGDVREAIGGWMAGHPNTSFGMVTTDFIDETPLLQYCLGHMGVPIAPPPAGIVSSLGAVTVNGSPNVYVLGTDAHLWADWWTGSAWEWVDLGTPPGGVDVMASLGAISFMGNPHVFVLGSDGHLWDAWWYNVWQWADLGTPSSTVSIDISLGALALPFRNQVNVYVRGSDGHLWAAWWNGTWQWTDLGTPSPSVGIESSMGAVAPNGVEPQVYVLGTDGNLWTAFWNGTWQWVNVGVPSTAVGIESSMGAVTLYGGGVQVYLLGSDQNLWVAWWSNGWQWTNLGTPSPGVGIADPLGTLVLGGNGPSVYVRGSDHHLWASWWSASGWTWTDLGPPSPTVSVRASMGTTSTVHSTHPQVYVLGSDDLLWAAWWDDSWHWTQLGTDS